MKARGLLRNSREIVAAVLLVCPFIGSSQTKQIHLRNEVITTGPKTSMAKSMVANAARSSGLFLMQCETALDASERKQLHALGVDVIKYVPDDAFIVRLNNVSVADVKALSFVRYIAAYRPEHKVHPRLAAAAHKPANVNQQISVNLLITPATPQAEIFKLRALFSSVDRESHLRQGTLIRGTLPPANVDKLAQSSSVLWIENAPQRKLVDEEASKIVGGDDGRVATPTITQQLGFDGSGVTVCVADTGLDTGDTNSMHPDVRGRVAGFQFYSPLTDGSDGYGHGTHCAGIVAGNGATGETDPDSGALYGLGVASNSKLFVERIFDDTANEVSPPPTDETLTRDAVRNGAQIGSNSWGNDTQGEYDTDAAQFDELVRDADSVTPGDQPYILEFSAGNAGPGAQTMDSPATAKNVLATGASQNVPNTLALTYGLYAEGPDAMSDFSSRGPCEDGRIKPDVVAPGSWIASMASSAAPDEASVAWTAIDSYYVYMGGTSMAGPHAAGAAAVFVQYYKSLHTNAIPSPALVKAALINSAVELDEANGGPGPIPNNDEGWGRITLTNLIVTNMNTAPRIYQFVDQTTLLTNGQVSVQHVFVQNSDQPLKITLAYTDVPGFPGAIPALVNDLDLEVVGPDGTLYRGNQFVGSESLPNAPNTDTLNNVEAVHLAQPLPGDYTVRVRAKHIVQDARFDTSAIDQDFALVASGNLERPGTGIVLLDRSAYGTATGMTIQVLDAARAGSSSVNVLVKSTTEPNGETRVLNANGTYGAFAGSMSTFVGNAANDGKLEIHDGDNIEVDYVDASGHTNIATAIADLVAPIVSNVTVTNDLGVIDITWQTSEPANSIVRYSTNLTFNLAITNNSLTTTHSIKLSKLVPGKTYKFYVASSDAAGNTTTNNNGGAFFSFVAVATPTVLLVDAYDPAPESPVIDDGTYTNAIVAAGFTFSHWKVLERGSPDLSDLQPFQVVIWRTTDDIINYEGTNNTLTAQEQFMIRSYLNGGGSFFMSSMGVLTQLGDVAFRRDVLQVGGFAQNPDPPSPCTSCDEDFGVPAIVGTGVSPVTTGMNVTLDYSQYPTFDLEGDVYGPDFSDTFTPVSSATPLLLESASGKVCGASYPPVGVDSPGRVVFLSFPLDTIPTNGVAPNNETVFVKNALKFLAPGANGVGTVSLDSSIYSVPDRVTVEVGDTDLIGAQQTSVTFSASGSTNQLTLVLTETAHPGLFRGTITLVATNSSATNTLFAQSGNTITAKYFDASAGSNVIATATIDTTPPVISGVSASARFGDAVVTWTTSEPSDSTVQYGQSSLLDRTAYNGRLTTNHSVSVTGLSANQTYYFQVVSRDQAGNVALDDNGGALYVLQTKRAPQPPWSDDLESGVSDWTVVPDPQYGSDINWTLGTPSDGLQSSAHSGANAWGSDLNGTPIPLFASSYLYSPIIDLSGLSHATLTFWDSFNFSSGFEEGQVMISTNSSTAPGSLPVLQDFSGDAALSWRQETIDLTPYVGKTVQIVWDYAGAFGDSYGWLVDDISITGTAGGAGGTIVITKNLGQGTFTLSGAVNQTGQSLATTISNAPPGQYMVDYSDVAFYQTPSSQTNTLTAGGTITFSGDYSFLDLNNNGISDAWERYYFGSASTNRTQLTDSDHDGATDYAEFIAGTNPTDAASKLIFLSAAVQTNKVVQLQWAAIPNRIYQIEVSTNLTTWTPITGWMQASGSPMSFTATNSTGASRMYRVQVKP